LNQLTVAVGNANRANGINNHNNNGVATTQNSPAVSPNHHHHNNGVASPTLPPPRIGNGSPTVVAVGNITTDADNDADVLLLKSIISVFDEAIQEGTFIVTFFDICHAAN
jgi:hypothetical protein